MLREIEFGSSEIVACAVFQTTSEKCPNLVATVESSGQSVFKKMIAV